MWFPLVTKSVVYNETIWGWLLSRGYACWKKISDEMLFELSCVCYKNLKKDATDGGYGLTKKVDSWRTSALNGSKDPS